MRRFLILLPLLFGGCLNSCDNVSVARCVIHCEKMGALKYGAQVKDGGYCTCQWELSKLPELEGAK